MNLFATIGNYTGFCWHKSRCCLRVSRICYVCTFSGFKVYQGLKKPQVQNHYKFPFYCCCGISSFIRPIKDRKCRLPQAVRGLQCHTIPFYGCESSQPALYDGGETVCHHPIPHVRYHCFVYLLETPLACRTVVANLPGDLSVRVFNVKSSHYYSRL